MVEYANPEAFALFALIPILIWRRRGVPRPGLRYPGVVCLAGVRPSWRQRCVWVPFGLRVLALACLVVALARPQEGTENVIQTHSGIAMQLVVDRSGSMTEPAAGAEGERDKLEVTKGILATFIRGTPDGGGTLGGRAGDLLGLIQFARFADTVAPLTLSHGMLVSLLYDIEVPRYREEDGTAIADAVLLAAARLQEVDRRLERSEGEADANAGDVVGGGEVSRVRPGQAAPYVIESRVIILLTDGLDNASRARFEDVAAQCKAWGIRVYTIGISGQPRYVRTPMGVMRVPGETVDAARLRYLAEETGGVFYIAEDVETLRNVYAEIDALEKSEIEAIRYIDHTEAFQPWAWWALMLLAVEVLLAATLCRVNP